MIYDFNIEKNTIIGLNNLSVDYPYATALLTYAFIERILKFYIFRNRKNTILLDQSIDLKYYDTATCKLTNKKINGLVTLSDDEFIENVLCKNAIEKCEKLLKITNLKYSRPRNDLMHSNSLMIKNGYLEDIKRNSEHAKLKKISFKLLKEAFNEYITDFQISIKNDNIRVVM